MPIAYKALLETIIVEYVIVLLFLRAKPLYLFGICILINCLTQPAAFFVYNFLIESSLNYPVILYFTAVEVCVIIAEVFLIKLLLKLNIKQSAVISLTANFATAMLSFFV